MSKLESITPANDGVHKYKAVFLQDSGRKKTVKFGAAGMMDFTKWSAEGDKKKAEDRKELYLTRHAGMGEDWNDPMTAGALSRWILWNKPSFRESLADFRKRFSLS
jgi:hypothetical protein